MDFQNRQFDLLHELDRIKNNPKATALTVGGIIAVIILAWLVMSSYYTLDANEKAILLRFGKSQGIRNPGLHFKLPFGIDTIIKARVEEKKREEFGFRTAKAGIETIYRPVTSEQKDESRILTGDLNILMVNWIVRYKIKNLSDYIFNIRNPSGTIRDVSESIMRMVIGDSSVDEVLTIGRIRIQNDVKIKMQEKLDSYKGGIQIINVRLKDVSPPEEVKDAFNAVNKSRQQQEKIINEAEKQRNTMIPEAQGKKERVIAEAKGSASKRINEAEGDVDRFLKLCKLYESAPDVTIRRIYLETMDKILTNVKQKYILETSSGDVLKLLNLSDINREKGK